jgi:hypothetical protein
MSPRLGYRSPFVSLLFAALLTVCGGSSGLAMAVDSINGPIEKPVLINLCPSKAATRLARLVAMLTSAGSTPVGMPLIFDSGSAGTYPVEHHWHRPLHQPLFALWISARAWNAGSQGAPLAGVTYVKRGLESLL